MRLYANSFCKQIQILVIWNKTQTHERASNFSVSKTLMCHQCLGNVILGINWVIFSDDKKEIYTVFCH